MGCRCALKTLFMGARVSQPEFETGGTGFWNRREENRGHALLFLNHRKRADSVGHCNHRPNRTVILFDAF
jgi:hypothetical protein